MNDAANWHQKWDLVDSAICLHNTAPELEETIKEMSWLSLDTPEEDFKVSKALLWSPPIRRTVGIRCITVDYWISSESNNAEIHSLTILQQQSG